MPAGNESGTNSDYRISNPPPVQNVVQLIKLGNTLALGGSVLMLAACFWLDSKPLVWLGFGLSVVGAVLVFVGLSKLPPGLSLRVGGERKLAAAASPCSAPGASKRSGSGVSRAANEACPAPAADSRYRLDAGSNDDCPHSWPANTWVTFYCRDTDEVLDAVYLETPATKVTLKRSLALSAWAKPFRIEVS